MNEYEHMALCAFVAAMLQRTLKQKENIEGFFDQLIARTEEMEKAHGAPPKTSLKIGRAKEDAHKMSVVQSVPDITNILMQMNLAFICSSKKGSFITSDAPCFLFNSQLQWQRFWCPNFEQKHVEVRMPLSPEISATFSWVNNVRGYLGIDGDLVHEHNQMVFGHSYEYFIANSLYARYRSFSTNEC